MHGCNKESCVVVQEQHGKLRGLKDANPVASAGWAMCGCGSALPPTPTPGPATHRGARAVLPPLWDLRLVGVVSAADHGAGRGKPAAPTARSAAARLPAWQTLLLQLRLSRAGWAAFGVQGCGGWAAWGKEGTLRAGVPWKIQSLLCALWNLRISRMGYNPCIGHSDTICQMTHAHTLIQKLHK